MTILLVDDCPDTLEVLTAFLTDGGFLVATASDGEQAVRMLLREPNRFAGVVTDIMLAGDVDGAQVAALARTLRPNVPIVVISGLSTGLMPFFAAGSTFHVLQKPFASARLCSLLRTAPSGLGVVSGALTR